MTIDAPDSSPRDDMWSEWLLRRRHGNHPAYEPVVRGMVHLIRDRVLDGAGTLTGKTLIDVGAGDGLITFGAFERAGDSLSAILVDVSKPLLIRAEKLATELGVHDRCSFIETSAERLDGIADKSADVLTTRAVLAYVADKAAAATQFHRVLRPGGRVSLAEPIYRDDAINLAAFANLLLTPDAAKLPSQLKLLHRCRIMQLPSTADEIQKNPLTNFSERDLAAIFYKAGFEEVHLEFHIDFRKQPGTEWDVFIDTAPRPGAPTLREVFAEHLTGPEQTELEAGLRPLVESGQYRSRDTTAYLTGCKAG